MKKNVLLAATALTVLATAVAMAAPPMSVFARLKVKSFPRHSPGLTLLYSQNSDGSGLAINSQNYTSGSFTNFNDQGADDFIVPAGQTWKVNR